MGWVDSCRVGVGPGIEDEAPLSGSRPSRGESELANGALEQYGVRGASGRAPGPPRVRGGTPNQPPAGRRPAGRNGAAGRDRSGLSSRSTVTFILSSSFRAMIARGVGQWLSNRRGSYSQVLWGRGEFQVSSLKPKGRVRGDRNTDRERGGEDAAPQPSLPKGVKARGRG
jgi:hypothetical protein